MKKIFLVVVLITLSFKGMASNIFCPGSIKCSLGGGGVHCAFSSDFYITSGSPVANKTYTFNVADSPRKNNVNCFYNGLGLSARYSVEANTSEPGNHWQPHGEGTWYCAGDALKCPFMKQ